MRLERVTKIDSASFKDWRWPSELHKFGDIGVLLGWNGSGKTVLSRILRSFEKGTLFNLPDDSKFTLETSEGSFTEKELNAFNQSIRVFNEDYIAETIAVGALPYVVYVGEDPVDYSKQEQENSDIEQQLSNLSCEDTSEPIAKRESERIRLLNGIGNIRKELESGYYNSYSVRSYRGRIDKLSKEIEDGKKLDDYIINDEQELLRLHEQLSNQESKQEEFECVKKWNDWIVSNVVTINTLLKEIPTHKSSPRIEAYKANDKSYTWIREGVELHSLVDEKKKLSRCMLCNSSITNAEELIKHFSEDILRIGRDISRFQNLIRTGLTDLSKVNNFYSKDASLIISSLEELKEKLKNKQENPTNIVDLFSYDDVLSGQVTDLQPLEEIAHSLEKHYVANSFNEYTIAFSQFEKCSKDKDALVKALREGRNKIATLKAKAKNVHTPAAKLNELLKVTFPFKGIELKDTEDEIGYEIYRREEPCQLSTLSEGERNFMALAYFLISLNTIDEGNQMDADGIVIIDDPVSSLDKHSIFQIFSILVGEVEKVSNRQYIFLTHNLDFFGHLSQHYKSEEATYHQILFNQSGSRIEDLNDLLKNFKSDYRYSLSLLLSKRSGCTPEEAYHAVNLLRRVWETLLHFKYGQGDLKGRLDHVYNLAIEEKHRSMSTAPQHRLDEVRDQFRANCLAMYRFINYGSHEFSSTASVDVTVLGDAHRRIDDFFNIVKLIDKHHHDSIIHS